MTQSHSASHLSQGSRQCKMVLRLHVLGPAFGLASIDAECLAAITYLAYAVPQTEYELVATSASAVPTREYIHAIHIVQSTSHMRDTPSSEHPSGLAS